MPLHTTQQFLPALCYTPISCLPLSLCPWFMMKNRSRAIASFGHVDLLLLATSNKQERGRERGKLVNTMLYLNKQSQMASFMPSASDKKRLNRKNKQQLTSHTQNWDQQGEQIPVLRTVLSHGSAPNPETCLASSAFGGACSCGVSESWKRTGQVFFFLIWSLVCWKRPWHKCSNVFYFKTLCC